MKPIRHIFLLLFAFWAMAGFAQDDTPTPSIVYDRSDSDVPLNITYNGREILIYGAV